jgi:dimethylglycine dehydrogenase
VLDLCGFSRFYLSGDGAAEWLRTQITGGLTKVGRMGLIYFADSRGRILTEMSVMRLGDDEFVLITAAAAQWHDYELLWRHLPAHLTLTDRTTEFGTLVVSGPNSRDLFAKLSDADLSKGWLTLQEATVAGCPARMARVSYAGELGWEVHTEMENIPAVYQAVVEAGAKPYGMIALNCLRMEKGYRSWKGDLTTDYTALEGGLNRFIKWDKPAFTGKEALEAQREAGVAKQFATFIVDVEEFDTPYMSTIWKGDEIVGETTSGGYGYAVDAAIAFGMLRVDCQEPGTELEIEMYGQRYKAVVQKDEPLWDPANDRLRA